MRNMHLDDDNCQARLSEYLTFMCPELIATISNRGMFSGTRLENM